MIVLEGTTPMFHGPLRSLRGDPPPREIFGLGQTPFDSVNEKVKAFQENLDKYAITFVVLGALIGGAGAIFMNEPQARAFQLLVINVGGFLLAAGLIPLIMRAI